MADAQGSGPCERKLVGVQVPPLAPKKPHKWSSFAGANGRRALHPRPREGPHLARSLVSIERPAPFACSSALRFSNSQRNLRQPPTGAGRSISVLCPPDKLRNARGQPIIRHPERRLLERRITRGAPRVRAPRRAGSPGRPGEVLRWRSGWRLEFSKLFAGRHTSCRLPKPIRGGIAPAICLY